MTRTQTDNYVADQETTAMSKVMIHPASYEDIHKAIDLAFKLFPVELKDRKFLFSGLLKAHIYRVTVEKVQLSLKTSIV